MPQGQRTHKTTRRTKVNDPCRRWCNLPKRMHVSHNIMSTHIKLRQQNGREVYVPPNLLFFFGCFPILQRQL